MSSIRSHSHTLIPPVTIALGSLTCQESLNVRMADTFLLKCHSAHLRHPTQLDLTAQEMTM